VPGAAGEVAGAGRGVRDGVAEDGPSPAGPVVAQIVPVAVPVAVGAGALMPRAWGAIRSKGAKRSVSC
jgi:hypothetical protein